MVRGGPGGELAAMAARTRLGSDEVSRHARAGVGMARGEAGTPQREKKEARDQNRRQSPKSPTAAPGT